MSVVQGYTASFALAGRVIKADHKNILLPQHLQAQPDPPILQLGHAGIEYEFCQFLGLFSQQNPEQLVSTGHTPGMHFRRQSLGGQQCLHPPGGFALSFSRSISGASRPVLELITTTLLYCLPQIILAGPEPACSRDWMLTASQETNNTGHFSSP